MTKATVLEIEADFPRRLDYGNNKLQLRLNWSTSLAKKKEEYMFFFFFVPMNKKAADAVIGENRNFIILGT